MCKYFNDIITPPRECKIYINTTYIYNVYSYLYIVKYMIYTTKSLISCTFRVRNNGTILYLGHENSLSYCEHDFPNMKGELEILITVNFKK